MAYREIVSRGASAGAPLKATLSSRNASSILGLLALRQISASDYKSLDPNFRVGVLVDALRTAKFFNAWGIPHLFWEEAARALIEEGSAIESPLAPLLDDRREAPIWGSEGAAEQQRYRYRVRDYAWALLNEVRGQRVQIPADPAERDKLIDGGKK